MKKLFRHAILAIFTILLFAAIPSPAQAVSAEIPVIRLEYKKVTSITDTTAQINGKCTYDNDCRPAKVGYYLGTSKTNLKHGGSDVIDHMKNPFDIWYKLKNLRPNTTYYYQLYYQFDGITIKEGIKSFRTADYTPKKPVIKPIRHIYACGETVKLYWDPCGGATSYEIGIHSGKSEQGWSQYTEICDAKSGQEITLESGEHELFVYAIDERHEHPDGGYYRSVSDSETVTICHVFDQCKSINENEHLLYCKCGAADDRPFPHIIQEKVIAVPSEYMDGHTQKYCTKCDFTQDFYTPSFSGDTWMKADDTWVFHHKEGYFSQNCWECIGGNWYYFDQDGFMLTGWQYINENWFYMDGAGHMQTGWQWIDGHWYLFNDAGHMQRLWQYADGYWYYFGYSGAMAEGWVLDGGFWYLFDGSGHMQTGWQQIDGQWYLFDTAGHMQTAWQWVDGYYYYFSYSGPMLTGWQQIGGSWYYMDWHGHMLTDWQYIGDHWFYMDTSGHMLTGWQYLNNYWFYMNSSGHMLTGWIFVDSNWYYMDSSGHMLTGWQQIDGQWNYFSYSGIWHSAA